MGFFNPFFRQILPLSFNSDFKKDNGSFQKLFPKNFFGLMKPGVLGSASEAKLVSASRACDTNFAFIHYILDMYLVFNFLILCAIRIKKVNHLMDCSMPCSSVGPNYFEQVQTILDWSKFFGPNQKQLLTTKLYTST